MPELPKASVVVPFRDRVERLERCLQALEGQTYPRARFEVAVVDNDSGAELAALRARFPTVQWLRETAIGSYAARNRAVRETSGEIIAFTDSDCVPDPEWLVGGISALHADRAEIIGGAIELDAGPHRNLNACERFEESMFYMTRHQFAIEECGFAVTANLFVRRDVLLTIGLFDPTLRSSGDREWCVRARAQGITPRYCAAARIRHRRRSTWPELAQKILRIKGGFAELAKKRGIGREWRYLIRYTVLDFRMARLPWGIAWKGEYRQAIAMQILVILIALLGTFETIRVLMGGRGRR